MTIVESLLEYVKTTPDKIALTDGKNAMTYRQLCGGIFGAVDILKNRYRLVSGDIVVLAANKQLSFVSIYFACHLLGIIVIPIAPDTNINRFSLIYRKTEPRLVVGFKNEIIKCPITDICEFDGITADVPETVIFPDASQIADIIFTTGTTGEPKGVQLSQKNIASAALNINTFIRNSQDDVEMLALPISHSFGLGRMRCALSNGQTLVLMGSFANMKKFFRLMEEFHVTGFGMVSASWAMIRKLSGLRISEYADQLNYIEIGSAPMPLEEKKILIRILPRTRICMHYGLTEASRSAFMEFHEDEERLDTIGKQSPNMNIEIRDEFGKIVPYGTEGEICVCGDAVTPGYYKLPEENKNAFWGEYFRTGDWGICNFDGYIRLLSRKKEMINVGGKKVSPMEVEAQLLKLDFVEDCACVAATDPAGILGEVVKAFIVTNQPEKVNKIIINREIGSQLESYKLPQIYEVIDEIPKTSSGKVQRLLLKHKQSEN